MAEPEFGSDVEQTLKLLHLDGLPSPDLFASRIEPSNVPAVFRGAVKGWDAVRRWDPRNGGLDYLEDKIDSNTVEAMLSRSAPVFYGDLQSHERVRIPFSDFIKSCKSCKSSDYKSDSTDAAQKLCDFTPVVQDEIHSTNTLNPDQVYLAQVPIVSCESRGSTELEALREDIETPIFLASKQLVSINFWMNSARTRSSTHYDPHHNLLCVLCGCKQVVLWPPSASPLLYPMPIYGEASNHSSVDIQTPDFKCHPRAKYSANYSQRATLQAGDAIFIPEGWFHQVDSDDVTIAVNFWWQSNLMSNMLGHMDAYYLRRILNRMVEKEMEHKLGKARDKIKVGKLEIGTTGTSVGAASSLHAHVSSEDSEENGRISLDSLEPLILQALHELVSLVHHKVNINADQITKSSLVSLEVDATNSQEFSSNLDNVPSEDDPVARFLLVLDPLVLKKVFLAMVNFPRTLEALVLHALSPTEAEILTRKFDEIDRMTTKEQQSEFYQQFYSAFDDQFEAMDALLSKKESFSFQAFRNVLHQFLGVTVDQPKFTGRS